MYVKIKMEPQSCNALVTLKDITYIPVDDDATITTLKMLIEGYVNVPAEKQEIRTLTKSFANSRMVKELCDDQGSTIMLYAFNDDFNDSQDPKFVCFLQIFTNESTFQFQEMEQQPSSGISRSLESSLHHSSTAGTLIALSETESSDIESDSESDSNVEGGSSGSSDNSLPLSEQKKHKINLKQNVDQKRQKGTPLLDKISPTLCKYLDEFPKSPGSYRKCYETNSEGSSSDDSDTYKTPNGTEKSHNPISQNDTSIATDGSIQTPATKEETSLCPKEMCITPKTHHTQSSPKTSTNPNQAPSELPTQESTLGKCTPGVRTNTSSTTDDSKHPYYTINPEKRQYVQCIYSNSSDINKTDFEKLLEWFFDRFGTCNISHQLQFVHPSAITHFDGKVWIACMNKETCDWVSTSLPQYSLHPYNVKLSDAACHLCEVVIPIVVTKANDLLDIFKLLEKQNPNLCTLQWCVLSRRILMADEQYYSTKAVSAFCTNELLSIRVDSTAKMFLDEVNQKLKYCFWQIVFKFVNN